MEIQEAITEFENAAAQMRKDLNAGHAETAKASAISTAQKVLAAFPAELKDTPDNSQ
ncbi:hypothetical protein ES707_15309 [subsurface metagenome]